MRKTLSHSKKSGDSPSLKTRKVLIAPICISLFLLLSGCQPDKPPRTPDRIFVIGIDGADWAFIDPLIQKGVLPNFAQLKKESTWCNLFTLRPTISPVIWTSMATGLKVEHHGVLSWRKGDQMVTSNWREGVPFWEIADRMGWYVAIINWWATYPATRLYNGLMVTDRFRLGIQWADEPGMVYPPKFSKRFKRYFQQISLGRLLQTMEAYGFPTRRRLKESAPHLLKQENVRQILQQLGMFFYQDMVIHKVALDVLKHDNPRLFTVTYRIVDILSHFASTFQPDTTWLEEARKTLPREVIQKRWNDPDVVRYRSQLNQRFSTMIAPALRWMDDRLGELLAFAGPGDAVIVVSDHGFRWRGQGFDHSRLIPGVPLTHGIFAMKGPDVRRGPCIKPVSVLHIAPLILGLVGAPLSEELAFDFPAFLFKNPDSWADLRRVKAYRRYHLDVNPEEVKRRASDKELEEELRSLGYIK